MSMYKNIDNLLNIGCEYSLSELAKIFNAPVIAKIKTGIKKVDDFVFLFHTLDNPQGDIEEDRLPGHIKQAINKPSKLLSISERNELSRYLHDYNNFFTIHDSGDIGSYEWEGQPDQTELDPLISNFINGKKYQYLLFVRLKKNNSEFIYCGEIFYIYHYLKYPNRPNPLRIVSSVQIKKENKITKLQKLYNFKPCDENLKQLEFNQQYLKDMESIKVEVEKRIKKSNQALTRGKYAERKAQKYYKERGFKIEDVSEYGSGCDFIASRWNTLENNEEKRYVEVKSTSHNNKKTVSLSRLQIEASVNRTKLGYKYDIFILKNVQISENNIPHDGEIHLINNYDAKIKFPEGAVKIDFSILRLGKDNSKNFK